VTLPARVTTYVVLGAIAAGVVAYGFHQVDQLFGGADDAATVAASQAQLALHPALSRWRARLAAAERHTAQLAAQSHELANALRIQMLQGRRVDTIQVLREIATADSSATVQCGLALAACQQRAASAEHEADSLATRLMAQVRVGQCHVLWVPCPSRTLSFLLGALGGGAAAYWMEHR